MAPLAVDGCVSFLIFVLANEEAVLGMRDNIIVEERLIVSGLVISFFG